MAYDPDLADRIRSCLAEVTDLEVGEKAMFGGLAFLLGGHMALAAGSGGALMVRVDPEASGALLEDPHASRMVMRDRPLKGWLEVAPAGLADDPALERWVRIGATYALGLPPK